MEPLPPNCIPIYFYDTKDTGLDLCVGKSQVKIDKNDFELTNTTPDDKLSSRRPQKEFTLLNKKTKSCQNEYKGLEMSVDSKYVLMEFKPNKKIIEFKSANHWINFMKTFSYHKCQNYDSDEDSEKIIEKKNKEDHDRKIELEKILKVNKSNIKTSLNPKEKKRGRKKQQKRSILGKNRDIDDNEKKDDNSDNVIFGVNGFDEDSHSSEESLGLEEKEESEKTPLAKKEETEKKNKEKNKEKKEDSENLDDESEEDEHILSSYGSDDVFDEEENGGGSRSFEERVGDSVCNLIRKHNNSMTYDEIIRGLKSEYPEEIETIQEIIEDILNKRTESTTKKNDTFYSIK